MKPELWTRAREVFEAAMDAPADRRAALVAERCGDDAELEIAVRRLLMDTATEVAPWLEAGVSQALVRRAMTHDSLAGRRVGDFEIREVLGSGGMATVFVAEQQHPRRDVALKVMRFGFASEAARHRFDYESEILATLRHPGIAQVYATGTYRDELSGQELPYFAMELVAGARPLDAFVEAQGLDLHATLRLFVEVCRAVQHGHQRGFLHRDLKPQNILVDDEGRPKIIDFGIARAAGPDREADALRTQAGEILGTLHYMSPEQVGLEAIDLDVRCDVYALGVVLFALVTGRLPFDFAGRPITAAIEAIRSQDPPRPSSLGFRFVQPALGEDLDWIVLAAMEKDRDRRYASVADLVGDVERMLAHEPVRARPPSRAYLAKKFIRRHRVAVVGALLLFLSLVGGITATAINLRRAQDAEEHVRQTLARIQIEATTNAAVNDFLLEMLRSPSPYEDGRDVRVLDLIDRTASRIDALYGARPELVTRMKSVFGSTYSGLGQPEKALAPLESALASGRAHLGVEHAQTLQAMQNLATCYFELGRFDDAGRLARETLAVHAKLPAEDVDPEEQAKSFFLVGLVAHKTGNQREAAELIRKAQAVLVELKGKGSRFAVQCGVALSAVYWELGRQQEAEDLLRAAVADGTATIGGDHPSVINALNNLGKLQMDRGLFSEAAKTFADNLTAHEGVLGPEHDHVLLLLSNLASALQRTGRSEEAVQRYRELIERRGAAGKTRHYFTAVAHGNLGACLESLDQLDAAATEFGRAFAVLDECGIPADHWLGAVFQKGLGVVRTKERRYPEAERSLLASIATFEAAAGNHRVRLIRALEALVALYDAWEKPEQAAAARARVADLGS